MKNYKRLEMEIIIVKSIDVLSVSNEDYSAIDNEISNLNSNWKPW